MVVALQSSYQCVPFFFQHCRLRNLASVGKSANGFVPPKKVASRDQPGLAIPAPDANAELQENIQVWYFLENECKDMGNKSINTPSSFPKCMDINNNPAKFFKKSPVYVNC